MRYVIKGLRVGFGYKAGKFANKIGISREYLRLIENGKAKNPSVTIMKKISKELKTSVQELFFLDEN